MDRRNNPSHGYRAVHIIAEIAGKPIEIQVRSSLQHLWAELSEKSSDVIDPSIKYGGGPESWRNFLTKSSTMTAAYEGFEKIYFETVALTEVVDAAHESLKKAHENRKKEVAELSEQRLLDYEVQEMKEELEDWKRMLERFEQEDREMRVERERLRKVSTDPLTGAITQLDELKRQKQ